MLKYIILLLLTTACYNEQDMKTRLAMCEVLLNTSKTGQDSIGVYNRVMLRGILDEETCLSLKVKLEKK